MPEAKTLAVDLFKEGSVSQILPCKPLFASCGLEWNKVHVQRHQQPAWKIPEHHHAQHEIVIYHFKQIAETERVLDGCRQREQIGNCEIVIAPANVARQSSWNREGSFTLLLLEPQPLADAAQELVDGNDIEIVPHFAIPDPVIHQVGKLLRSELESHGLLGSFLYLDSLFTALTIHLLRNYSVRKPLLQNHAGGLPKHKLKQAIAYINTHLDRDLSLDEISMVVQIGSCYFASLFKQSTGVSPSASVCPSLSS